MIKNWFHTAKYFKQRNVFIEIVICVAVDTVEVIVATRKPKFLYISKGRKSEAAMTHEN